MEKNDYDMMRARRARIWRDGRLRLAVASACHGTLSTGRGFDGLICGERLTATPVSFDPLSALKQREMKKTMEIAEGNSRLLAYLQSCHFNNNADR